MTAPAPTLDQATAAAGVTDRLIRIAFLTRLAALVVGMGGLVGTQLTIRSYVSVVALAVVSYLGLAVPSTRVVLVRHPILAMADLALVVLLVLLVGVASPLALAAVGTAFLIGVLYPLRTTVLLAAVLVLTYLIFALDSPPGPGAFLVHVGMPAILAMFVFVGHEVRRIQLSQAEVVAELGRLRESQAAERERARLAREMHDGVAKSLQGIALGATGLQRWIERDVERARAEAVGVADSATRALGQARDLLVELRVDRPSLPLRVGLTEVVEAWRADTGRTVRLDLDDVAPVSADARYELLGAVREALANTERHARGAEVVVSLSVADGGAEVVVRDDGPGFDGQRLAQARADGRFGVSGMHERLAEAGGWARVDAEPGRGARVRLWVPTDPSGPDAGSASPVGPVGAQGFWRVSR